MIGVFPEDKDLILLGADRTAFIRRQAIRAGSAFGVAVVACVVLDRIAGGLSPLTVLLLVGAAPVGVWMSGVVTVGSRASVHRGDMDLAVAVFLDLVNVLLAGGAGVETSMLAAAASGDGWAFEEIRVALARAQSSRRSYWEALAELGARIQVESLEDVAHSVQLAGEHGARVRQSLAAKAQALRARNLARIEHEAEQRTEHMGLPIVVLFVGFILLVGYPAFTTTVTSL